MGPSDSYRPNFAKDAFAGTADYYVQYRVPYPEALLADLLRRSSATGGGRLLDLASGPGRLALALAGSFREIWAIDIEPEMIEAGKREAARQGAAHIAWTVGRGEDMEAPPASFELVVIGEAFHRLDQRRIAANVLRWLKPGGHVATMGCYSILSAKEPWQGIVMETVRRHTGGGARKDGGATGAESGPAHDQRVLREAGFAQVANHTFVVPHTWTIGTILGFLYSTSVCSRRILGAGAEAFESDLRAALHAHDPGGAYREEIQWGYTIGGRPR